MGEHSDELCQLAEYSKAWNKEEKGKSPSVEAPLSPAEPDASSPVDPHHNTVVDTNAGSVQQTHCHKSADPGQRPDTSEGAGGPVKVFGTDIFHSVEEISDVTEPRQDLLTIGTEHFFIWKPPETSTCAICENLYPSVVELETHYHQYHVNPHFLSQSSVKLYRLSNFLVRTHEDADQISQNPALYRCHECFNTFSKSSNLKVHLVNHQALCSEQMAPKTELCLSEMKKIPEEVASRNKGGVEVVGSPSKQGTKPMSSSLENLHARPRRQASLKRIVEIDSDLSDEFNSNSENEADLSNRRQWRPQRECKSRTKTLVAISLAEQEYDKFDLGNYVMQSLILFTVLSSV